MKERHKTNSAVFLMLVKKENNQKQILLQLRQNTGYMDNMFDMAASGHVESNEKIEDSLIREVKEEINITLSKENIKLVSFEHKASENYYNFFFTCDKFEGTLKIMEPNKCAELTWFDLNNLPANLIDHNKRAIKRLLDDIVYEIK